MIFSSYTENAATAFSLLAIHMASRGIKIDAYFLLRILILMTANHHAMSIATKILMHYRLFVI